MYKLFNWNTLYKQKFGNILGESTWKKNVFTFGKKISPSVHLWTNVWLS